MSVFIIVFVFVFLSFCVEYGQHFALLSSVINFVLLFFHDVVDSCCEYNTLYASV
jgi:hypothetical protein